MKPDQFADHIRRKLESVEPTFREKDWTQMQRTMRLHGGGVFKPSVPQWVLPTAGMMAAAGLSTIIYFQYSANQQLKNEVRSLNNTVSALRQAPVPVTQVPDTVYVTRYIEKSGSSSPAWSGELSNGPVDRSLRKLYNQEQLANARENPDNSYANKAENALPSTHSLNQSANEKTATSSDLSRSGNSTNRIPSPNPGVGSLSSDGSFRTGNAQGTNQYASGATRNRRNRPTVGADPGTYTNPAQRGGLGNDRNTQPYDPLQTDRSTGTDAEANGWAFTNIDDLDSRLITVDTAYYQEGMSRIARRMRRALLPAYAGTAPVVSEPIPDWRWRMGVGGMLGIKQWGAGLFSEIRLGDNWIAGVGLTANNLSGGTFLTDDHYENRTKHNFRKEYAGGIDPRFQILNITRHTMAWQIPVSIGYRMNLLKHWAIIPAVGASFNIDNREQIAFNYLRGPKELAETTLLIQYPKKYMHNMVVSVGVEKIYKHASIQASPYFSLPVTTNPYTLNSASAGVRLRLFYNL